MKVLFLAMSSSGYGETLIGLSLARQLARDGIMSHFVITTSSERLLAGTEIPFTVLDDRMGPFVQILIDDVVRSERPDLIVLSDYFTYARVFAIKFDVDPWFIDNYGLPIVPIDIWEWDRTSFDIDIFCGKHMHVTDRILGMPAYLRPVPLGHLSAPGNTKSYPFSLCEGDERISRRTREHLRTVLGLKPQDRVIMFALARWQLPDYDDDNGNRIARGVPQLLVHYLLQLPPNVHIVSVGEPLDVFSGLPKERVHFLPPCSPSRFNVLLGSVDLFVSLNVAATTLTRAILAGVPGLVLFNRYELLDGADIDCYSDRLSAPSSTFVRRWLSDQLPIYPFRMWPLGFYRFLDPLLEDNPYLDTFLQLDLFDEHAVRGAIEGVLFDESLRTKLANAQNRYSKQLKSLGETPEVFRAMARAIGVE